MQRFWDERAKEDAYYFVDNRLDYGAPDVERFWDGGEEALALLLEIAGASIDPHHTVLDIGCGLGRLTRAAASRAERVLALDVSEEMLSQARELNPELSGVDWIHGDGRTLAPIPDSSVDCCISLVVFQHIPDPAITLGYVGEMGRVLRPGGWAAFQISNDPSVHRRKLLTRKASRHRAWRGSAVELGALRDAAATAGLTVEALVGEGTQFCLVRLAKV
jgi:SAM-dependent methyltransferase